MKKYNFNPYQQLTRFGDFFELTPLHLRHVVPGTNYGMEMSARFESDIWAKPLRNMADVQILSFYVPYRLLSEDFANAISDPDFTYTVPFELEANTAAREWLFEPVGEPKRTAWASLAYQMIWNKFFRDQPQSELTHTDTAGEITGTVSAPQSCAYKPDQEILRALDDPQHYDATIDTSGASTTPSAIRAAFADEQWHRIRSMYGEKYSDYLRALDVKTNWSVNDEPELLGVSQHHLKITEIENTNLATFPLTAPMGYKQGFYDHVCKHKFGGKFFPEHGLVMTLALPRMRLPLTIGQGITPNDWINIEDYWSPQHDQEILETIPTSQSSLFLGATSDVQTFKYDYYRSGQDFIDTRLDTAIDSNTAFRALDLAALSDAWKYRLVDRSDVQNYQTLLWPKAGTPALGWQYQMTSKVQESIKTPVRPPQSSKIVR